MAGHVGSPSVHTGWKDWGRGKGALSKEGAGVRTNYDNSLPKRKTDTRLRGLSEKRGEYGPDLRFGVRGESIGIFFFLLNSPRQWGRR